MHSELTKQVAVLFAQSRSKNDAIAVFIRAPLVQKKSLLQIGYLRACPFTSTVSGSAFLNSLMINDFDNN